MRHKRSGGEGPGTTCSRGARHNHRAPFFLGSRARVISVGTSAGDVPERKKPDSVRASITRGFTAKGKDAKMRKGSSLTPRLCLDIILSEIFASSRLCGEILIPAEECKFLRSAAKDPRIQAKMQIHA